MTDTKGNPLKSVNISLEGTSKGAATNANGNFRIEKVSPGTYMLNITAVGYRSQNVTIAVVAGQTLAVPVVQLKSQSQELDEVVVNANKNRYLEVLPSPSLRLNTKLIEVPQNIQIVSDELIREQIAFDIFEGISRNTSGVRRAIHQAYPLIYMRGFSIDGMRNGMNNRGHQGPMRDDMSFVERIEFVKGPAGFMMGNTSLGGLYNVVTKKPTGSGKKSAALTFGSFDTYRVELDVDDKLTKDNKLLYRLNVMGKLQGSHIDYQYENRYAIAPSLKYQFSDNTQVTLEYIYQNSRQHDYTNYMYSKKGFKEFPVNTSYSDPRKDPVKFNEHNVYTNFEHNLNSNWKLTAQVGFTKYMHQGTMLNLQYNSLKDDGSALRYFSLLDNENTIISGQAFVNGEFNTGGILHKLIAGLDMGTKEYFADWAGLTPWGKGPEYNIYKPELGAGKLKRSHFPVVNRSLSVRERSGRYTQRNAYSSLYLQDQFAFFDNALRLSLAGRFTTTKRFERTGKLTTNEVFTPRVGLSYSFTNSGSLYGVFDQAFQDNYGLPLKNGEPLKPSMGSNIEFGVKKEWFDNTLQTSVSVYTLTRNNITTTAGVAPDQFSEQIGEARSQGVEVDVTGTLLPNLNIMLNYAYTDAKITKDKKAENIGGMLPGAAKHISNLWLNYTIAERSPLAGLGFSLGYQYQKDRASWPVGNSRVLPDDYFSLDGGVSYKAEHFQLSMLVNNITNNYNYTGFYPGAWGYKHYGWIAAPPRNFRVQLRFFF